MIFRAQNPVILVGYDAVRENAMKRPEDQRSPRFADPAVDVFYHAPTVIFLSADQQNRWNAIDCGIAVENLALAAESMGLGSVVLGIFDEKKLAELLELPEGMGVACLMPLGYPAEEPAAPKRKEVADLLSVK